MNSVGQHTAGISEGQGSRAIDAVLGQAFSIRLWEDRTRGEQWVPSYNTKALTLVDDRFLRVAGNNAVENGRADRRHAELALRGVAGEVRELHDLLTYYEGRAGVSRGTVSIGTLKGGMVW